MVFPKNFLWGGAVAANQCEGGKGNDMIYNNWDSLSGKPYSYSDSSNVTFKYAEGDGDDIIYGFKKN